MAAPAEYLAKEAGRKATEAVARALEEVAPSCSDSTSLGDALRRVAKKIRELS